MRRVYWVDTGQSMAGEPLSSSQFAAIWGSDAVIAAAFDAAGFSLWHASLAAAGARQYFCCIAGWDSPAQFRCHCFGISKTPRWYGECLARLTNFVVGIFGGLVLNILPFNPVAKLGITMFMLMTIGAFFGISNRQKSRCGGCGLTG